VTQTDEQRYLEDTKALERDFKKYMFHPMRDKVFAGLLLDKDLCESVIHAVTGVPFAVQDIIAQHYEHGELAQGRTIVLDIKATNPDGVVCNLEVQVRYYKGGAHENRVVFHASRLLSKQLKASEDFDAVRPVIVIFFNFESASQDFIRHISLKDDKGALYSGLIKMHEVNTMEILRAKTRRNFVKIFSCFLLYACERDKFYKKLKEEGISQQNKTVKRLMLAYYALTGDEKVKKELSVMTAEDKVFLATRNYADVLATGREEGIEIGVEKCVEKGVEIGISKTLSIIRDLHERKPVNEIIELYKVTMEKVEEIQAAMKLNMA
jgi:predicted transposase/invertase (TIGR01784 family)